MKKYLCISLLWLCTSVSVAQVPKFRMLVIAEHDKNHTPYVDRATEWLNHLALDSGFVVDYIQDATPVGEAFLEKYHVVFQMNFPPYMWSDSAKVAFQRYIETGKGGWVGVHHATLLGNFDGYPMWNWFSKFMGGIRFKDYIASFAKARVHVERTDHPIMRGLPSEFIIERDEWYTYDRSPRPNVTVLAHVDENTYSPPSTKMMGDHPVVWLNERMRARNVYIFMGHDPILFEDVNYTRLLTNALFWAANK